MFQRDLQYFPSMQEIRDQLIEAQISKINQKAQSWENMQRYEHLVEIYTAQWDWLFGFEDLGNIKRPLTCSILSNPVHQFTQRIMYLYSMESFIYEDLNRASRNKDASKIQYYGAFAAALSYIISSANKNNGARKNPSAMVQTLYRGIKLKREELEVYRTSKIINLLGYTSTSRCQQQAQIFAFEGLKTDQVPVVLQIEFEGHDGIFEMGEGFSAYPEEEEVLLQDGLEYSLQDVTEHLAHDTDKPYFIVKLKYPA